MAQAISVSSGVEAATRVARGVDWRKWRAWRLPMRPRPAQPTARVGAIFVVVRGGVGGGVEGDGGGVRRGARVLMFGRLGGFRESGT